MLFIKSYSPLASDMRRALLIAVMAAASFANISFCRAAQLFSVTYGDNRINRLDADTGALLGSFAPPVTAQPSGGSGLAFSGTTLYFADITQSPIYRLNPVDGAVLSSFARPAGSVDALAYGVTSFGGTLFTLDYTANRLHLVDPLTGALFDSHLLGFDAVGGMDFNHVSGALYVSANTIIHRVNPMTGASLGSFNPGAGFQTGLGLVGGRLFTGGTAQLSIVERDPVTGALLSSFPSPGGRISALAGGPIPEPTALALIATAAVTLLTQRRRD